PPTGFTGTTTFCYTASNTAGQSNSTCVTVNVNPAPTTGPNANNRPIANNDNTRTTAGMPVTVPVLANDTDPNGPGSPNGQLSNPTLLTPPAVGTAVVNNDGTVTYTPPAGFTGTVSIPYQVCDKGTPTLCSTATMNVNVQPARPTSPIATPQSPVAVDDALLTTKNTSATGTVATNDRDPNSPAQALTYASGQPRNGTVTMQPNGSYTYTPQPGFVGPDSFTYNVCNPAALCEKATVSVLVQQPANQPPIVTPDFVDVIPGIPAKGNVLTNDKDPEGTPLTAQVIGTPPPGLTLSPDGSYTYTAPVGTTAPVTVPVQVCDSNTPPACTTTTLTLVPVLPIQPGNNPPIANPDSPRTTAGVPLTVNVTANDVDPDGPTLGGNPLSAPLIISGPRNGTAVVNPDGTVSYTPAPGYTGPDQLVYRVCDLGTPPLCATAAVNLTVDPTRPAGVTNTAPVAIDDALLTTLNTSATGTVAANDRDPEGQSLTFSKLSSPTNGTVVLSPNGSYSFTPAPGFAGTDNFVYQVCDGASPALCSTATAYLTVANPAAPSAYLLQVRVLLQGALFNVNSGTLMRDDLRTGGYLPLTSPYSVSVSGRFAQTGGGGGETTSSAVLRGNAGTPDAIVDWVLVELRNPANPALVVATRSALVQRDGDVVLPADGVSPLSFTGLTGTQYFVSVKHRNHLGVMTATALPLSVTGTLVDFTTMTNVQVYDKPGAVNYNGVEMISVNGKRALWAGDANADGKVKYIGGASDNTPILNDVIGAQGSNPSPQYNYDFAFGYLYGDVDMNSKAKYQGAVNDPTWVFSNVVATFPLNTLELYNYDFLIEQIP
ncbi:MAG: Ig-like domain-containing protein, partial [Rudanella sp.]|nr:Ig-like domain-containing protein [Rudanella sp.]